jgi:hypothetical protein
MARISYTVTSSQFEGCLSFTYENGWLAAYRCDAELSGSQLQYLHERFPLQEGMLHQLRNGSRTLRIETAEEDLSFGRFWELYGYKVARKKAEALWERLSEADRKLALGAIRRYDRWLSHKGLAKCYPETYLRNRRWEDNLT